MQQTDKYKLNKPGADDPIAIAPLNENMDKVEAALLTKASAAETAALEQRVVSLEAHHIYVGSYTGAATYDNMTQTIHLGFTPIAVLVHSRADQTMTDMGRMHLLTAENMPIGGMSYEYILLKIVDGGFTATTYGHDEWNDKGTIYHFIAFC